MSNLRRRLRKLEARLTDSSGLVPNSPAWLDYWLKEVDMVIAGEDRGGRPRIPIAAIDAILAARKKHDGASGDESDQQPDSQA